MADEKGKIIDGDQILATIAQAWKTQGKLLKNKVPLKYVQKNL